MALRIKWTKRAENNFGRIVNYLEQNFGESTKRNFVQRTFSIIESLSEFPEMGTIELVEKGVRGFVITKHNRLFYRFTDEELILLSFFDTRRDPKKKNI